MYLFWLPFINIIELYFHCFYALLVFFCVFFSYHSWNEQKVLAFFLISKKSIFCGCIMKISLISDNKGLWKRGGGYNNWLS